MAKAKTDINPALFDVIRKPVITEKSTLQGEQNKITFKVLKSADKPTIKAAVEAAFGVEVKSVNTIVQNGKTKRFRGRAGVRSDYKKAIITLKDGQNLDVLGGA